MSAWVVADGSGKKYRSLKQGIAIWVDDIEEAIQFARRDDAEKFAEEDEDAWRILPHFPVKISVTAADRIQELLLANDTYLTRAQRAEAALENIARFDFSHLSPTKTGTSLQHRLAVLQAMFGLMNYASAAKARLFDPREFKVGKQPSNIEISVIDISNVDWTK